MSRRDKGQFQTSGSIFTVRVERQPRGVNARHREWVKDKKYDEAGNWRGMRRAKHLALPGQKIKEDEP